MINEGRVVASDTPTGLVDRHGSPTVMRFSPPDEVVGFDRVTGVREVRRVDGGRVELHGERAMIAHVGAALVEAGHVPDDIVVAQPTLEDVLLPMIGGG